jgi:hypothetical protein
MTAMNDPESAPEATKSETGGNDNQSMAALIAGFQALLAPKTSVGTMVRTPEGYQMVKQENINPQGL